jgi:hypothetical protein
MIRYYRATWPDEEAPPGEPKWYLYEVDLEKDNVLRDVQIFDDGSVNRNSLDIEARYGPRFDSLCDSPFLPLIDEVPMTEITQEEFQSYWSRGRDRSFWNAAPADQIPPRS